MFLFVTCVLVTAFSANTREVLVRYNGSSATVDVSPDITSLVTVSVNGANVVVVQSGDVNDEITYRLIGASGDGSFVHTGVAKNFLIVDEKVCGHTALEPGLDTAQTRLHQLGQDHV